MKFSTVYTHADLNVSQETKTFLALIVSAKKLNNWIPIKFGSFSNIGQAVDGNLIIIPDTCVVADLVVKQ